jgi:hypothetical protein
MNGLIQCWITDKLANEQPFEEMKEMVREYDTAEFAAVCFDNETDAGALQPDRDEGRLH